MVLKTGEKIELVVTEGSYRGEYISIILSTDSSEITVAIPVVRGHFVPIRPGSSVEVRVCRNDAIYMYSTEILRRVEEGGLKGLVLPMPNKITRMQRRGDVRVEVSLPAELWIYDSPQKEQWKVLPVRIIDLSAGGLRIELSQELSGDFLMDAIFSIPGDELIRLSCRYIRGGRLASIGRYWAALRFDPIKEHEKKRILKFVFQKQQDLRAKGLI